jgi:hypothetical protein
MNQIPLFLLKNASAIVQCLGRIVTGAINDGDHRSNNWSYMLHP